jgi:RNase adapter protein RapZ
MQDEQAMSLNKASEALEIIIVSGLSGAGKSIALNVLEDAGYFAVDNLPSAMMTPLLTLLLDNPEVTKVALVADSRDRGFPDSVLQMTQTIKAQGHSVKVIFLDAADDILIRRFSETRRPHPLLSKAGAHLSAAISMERVQTRPVKEIANQVLDTSALNIHQLKSRIRDLVSIPAENSIELVFMSFGFKYGIPPEASYLFDIRFLPNPYFVPALQGKTGLDRDITEWIDKWEKTAITVEKLKDFLGLVIPANEEEGKTHLTICIGCTGGRHRSVAITEKLSSHFKILKPNYHISTIHRDIGNQADYPVKSK